MTKRRITAAVATFAIAGLIGACGSDGSSDDADAATTTTVELSAEQQAEFEIEAEFARCMRDQGIEDFPDPQVSGDGFLLVGFPLSEQRDSEQMDAAFEACAPRVDDAASQTEPGGAETGEAASATPAGWERIVPGGDCQCSDGSQFSFLVRKANPEKVVLFFQDGGACFSAETCAPDSGLYNIGVSDGPGESGVFDFDNERNPFADYSVVWVPYCTADVFIGNATTEYAPDLTIQHKGYVNGTAALDHLAATFPGATDVVVMGESAGSVAAPLYGGLVSDRFPDAKITVLADGSGSYPDLPEANRVIAAAWGTGNTIPPWPENAGLTAEQWSLPGLFVQSGRHDPDIVFARHDYAYDERQEPWFPLLGIPTADLLSRIDVNEAQIEAAGVDLLSYVAAGDDHTTLTDGTLYTESVNGQSLVDWVTDVIDRRPVEDVHCTDCAPE